MDSDTGVNRIGVLLILLGMSIILTPHVIFPINQMHGLFAETITGTRLPIHYVYSGRE